MTVVFLRAHGPIDPEPKLSLAGAVGVHRPHGPAAGMGVEDGSATDGAAPASCGGLAKDGGAGGVYSRPRKPRGCELRF